MNPAYTATAVAVIGEIYLNNVWTFIGMAPAGDAF
jgi:hypothetical protein